ncbi:MAG: tetratricopeptide repeat protein [bacterium]
MTRSSILLLTICLAAAPLWGQQVLSELQKAVEERPDDVATLVQLARAYHEQGTTGDKQAVKQAAETAERALQLDPGNALALAIRGSATTMRGRDTWLPWKKLDYVEEGCDDLDKAVEMAPDNIDVRLFRAINSLRLPDFFHRLHYAVKDLKHLRSLPHFGRLPANLRATVFYYSGVAYQKSGLVEKGLPMLQQAVQAAPASEEGKRAAAELGKIEDKP